MDKQFLQWASPMTFTIFSRGGPMWQTIPLSNKKAMYLVFKHLIGTMTGHKWAFTIKLETANEEDMERARDTLLVELEEVMSVELMLYNTVKDSYVPKEGKQ